MYDKCNFDTICAEHFTICASPEGIWTVLILSFYYERNSSEIGILMLHVSIGDSNQCTR